MTNAKTGAAPNAASTDIHERILQIQDDISIARGEIRSLQGKLSNRDPAIKARLGTENTRLRARMAKLEAALQAAFDDRTRPRETAEARLQLDILKAALVQHCRKANIDSEIWKNIES